MNLKKQAVDQSAHFVAAAAVIAVAALIGDPVFAGGWIGLCLGVVREITEHDPATDGRSLLDILFWTLGGAVSGFAIS